MISTGDFSGKVSVQFNLSKKAEKVIFDTGNLRITKLNGDNVLGFEQKDKKVIIDLLTPEASTYKIQIEY